MSRDISEFEEIPSLYERQTMILDWLHSRGCRVDYSDDNEMISPVNTAVVAAVL